MPLPVRAWLLLLLSANVAEAMRTFGPEAAAARAPASPAEAVVEANLAGAGGARVRADGKEPLEIKVETDVLSDTQHTEWNVNAKVNFPQNPALNLSTCQECKSHCTPEWKKCVLDCNQAHQCDELKFARMMTLNIHDYFGKVIDHQEEIQAVILNQINRNKDLPTIVCLQEHFLSENIRDTAEALRVGLPYSSWGPYDAKLRFGHVFLWNPLYFELNGRWKVQLTNHTAACVRIRTIDDAAQEVCLCQSDLDTEEERQELFRNIDPLALPIIFVGAFAQGAPVKDPFYLNEVHSRAATTGLKAGVWSRDPIKTLGWTGQLQETGAVVRFRFERVV